MFRAINAGKSVRNEDQATSVRGVLYTTAAISVKQDPLSESTTILPVENNIENNKEPVNESVETTLTSTPVSETEETSSKPEEESSHLVNSNVPDDPKFTTPPSTPEIQRKVVVSVCLMFYSKMYFLFIKIFASVVKLV